MSNLKGDEIKYIRYYLHSSTFGVQILKPLASASSDFGVVVQTFTIRGDFDRLIPVRAGDGPWNASPGGDLCLASSLLPGTLKTALASEIALQNVLSTDQERTIWDKRILVCIYIVDSRKQTCLKCLPFRDQRYAQFVSPYPAS